MKEKNLYKARSKEFIYHFCQIFLDNRIPLIPVPFEEKNPEFTGLTRFLCEIQKGKRFDENILEKTLANLLNTLKIGSNTIT